jgi:hypothetical protein
MKSGQKIGAFKLFDKALSQSNKTLLAIKIRSHYLGRNF